MLLQTNMSYFQNKLKDNVDVLMISETKIDDSFPDGKFTFDKIKLLGDFDTEID